MYIIIRQDFS